MDSSELGLVSTSLRKLDNIKKKLKLHLDTQFWERGMSVYFDYFFQNCFSILKNHKTYLFTFFIKMKFWYLYKLFIYFSKNVGVFYTWKIKFFIPFWKQLIMMLVCFMILLNWLSMLLTQTWIIIFKKIMLVSFWL